jgi:hypothetical protein
MGEHRMDYPPVIETVAAPLHIPAVEASLPGESSTQEPIAPVIAAGPLPEAPVPAMAFERQTREGTSGYAAQPVAASSPGLLSELPAVLAGYFADVDALKQPVAPGEPSAWITHYGERFNDRTVGCWNYGDYSSDDPTIIAVNPTLYDELPCGTLLELCGPGGCMVGARKDSCPGCRPNGFDLSEAGFKRVCGDADGVCTATVEVLTVCQVRKFGKSPEEAAALEAAEMAGTGRIPCHPESG